MENSQPGQFSESIVIDLQYFPCLEYFACLLKFKTVYIEAHEHFQKQTYRNRCYIRAANKIDTLSVPVLSDKQALMKDVKIDYQQRWLNDHWRAIASAYGKAPFFEYYAHFFEQILFKRHRYLFDLNWELLTKCLTLLGVKKDLIPTSSYVKSGELPHLDLRSAVHPKKNYTDNKIYLPVAYVQNFGNTFVPNLSVIDLLFCKGTQARQIIEQSIIR